MGDNSEGPVPTGCQLELPFGSLAPTSATAVGGSACSNPLADAEIANAATARAQSLWEAAARLADRLASWAPEP